MKRILLTSVRSLMILFSILSLIMSCEKVPFEVHSNSYDKMLGARISTNRAEAISDGLKILGGKLAWLKFNDIARKIFYKKIDERFDGDSNVLIEDLLTSLSSNNINITEKLYQGDSIPIDLFNQVLYNFKIGSYSNKQKEPYYAQIYIPNYENLKKANIINYSEPTFVFYNGDETSDIIEGYKLNKENKLEKLKVKIDEEYSKYNEVWVFSINERVHSQTDIDQQKKRSMLKQKSKGARAFFAYPGNAYSDCPDLPVGQAPNFGQYGIKLTIPSMSPKTFKEPWYAGDLEISMTYTTAWGNGYTQYAPYNQYQTSGQRDVSIKNHNYSYSSDHFAVAPLGDVNRSDVGQYYQVATTQPYFLKKEPSYTSIYYEGWGKTGDARRDCIYYAIYELDTGSNNRSTDITSNSFNPSDPSTNMVTIPFSSNDEPFMIGYIYWYMSIPNGLCNTSVIGNDMNMVIRSEYATF